MFKSLLLPEFNFFFFQFSVEWETTWMEESGKFGGRMLRDKPGFRGGEQTPHLVGPSPSPPAGPWGGHRSPPSLGSRPSATHPMPLMALIYRLSCSFTEQFMGIPVTWGRKHREGPGLAGAPGPAPEGGQPPPPQLRALLGKHTLPKGLLRPPRVPSTVHSVFIVPLPSSQRHKIDLRVKKSLSSHNFSCLKPNDSFPLCLIFFFSRTF